MLQERERTYVDQIFIPYLKSMWGRVGTCMLLSWTWIRHMIALTERVYETSLGHGVSVKLLEGITLFCKDASASVHVNEELSKSFGVHMAVR